MAKNGKLHEAVVALERGSALLLSEVLERNRANLERLKELNYNDLYKRYYNAINRLNQLTQVAQQRIQVENTSATGITELQAAREELNATIAAIQQVPGYENFLAPPTFENIKDVAKTTPLVYIFTTEFGGLALVLDNNTAVTVTPVWLPDLTDGSLQEILFGFDDNSVRVGYLKAYEFWKNNLQDKTARDVWFSCLNNTTSWLWQVLMEQVLAALTNVSKAVLLPLGFLRLLPLHSAWTEDSKLPTGCCYALDKITFSYAPNARALTAAQAIASEIKSDALLGVYNPKTEGVTPLAYAQLEVEIATSTFTHHYSLSGKKASREKVLSLLPKYSIVHFACHGFADLTKPLNSGLIMANQVLTLQDLLDLHLPKARLAILSACETNIPGINLPDEVISLPTGLLQAGFAGITASLWAVADISTMMLMTLFYESWRLQGLEPSEALNQAQKWVRDTTNQEKANYFKNFLLTFGGSEVLSIAANVLYIKFASSSPKACDYQHPYYWAAFAYVGV